MDERIAQLEQRLVAVEAGTHSFAVELALATYSPLERRVLNKITDTADIVEVDGKAAYLVIPSTPELLDDLAAVGAQFVDLDDSEDIEPENEHGETPGGSADLEPGHDNEATAAGFPNPTF